MLVRGFRGLPGSGAWKILVLIVLKYVISFPFYSKMGGGHQVNVGQ